jgi:hypothetical protein
VKFLGETLGVHKNDGLGHTASVKNIHYELGLFFWVTAVVKLLNVVQLEGFLLYGDLLGLCNDLFDRILNGIRVGCAEKHVLDFLIQLT